MRFAARGRVPTEWEFLGDFKERGFVCMCGKASYCYYWYQECCNMFLGGRGGGDTDVMDKGEFFWEKRDYVRAISDQTLGFVSGVIIDS